MAEIIPINNKEIKEKEALMKRMEELLKEQDKLNKVLGYERDENGSSLNGRALRGNQFAYRRHEEMKLKNPVAFERHIAITEELYDLEDRLGITAEYEEILNGIDIDDEEPEK